MLEYVSVTLEVVQGLSSVRAVNYTYIQVSKILSPDVKYSLIPTVTCNFKKETY